MENNWEIWDETKVVISGTDDQMDSAWDVLTSKDLTDYVNKMLKIDAEFYIPDLVEIHAKYYRDTMGILKLIEIHKTHG